jgi:hypothetical protein
MMGSHLPQESLLIGYHLDKDALLTTSVYEFDHRPSNWCYCGTRSRG